MQKSICKEKNCRNFGKYCRIPGHAPDVENKSVAGVKKVIPRKDPVYSSQPLKPRQAPIAKKSKQKKAAERAEVEKNGKTKTSNFFQQMLEEAPELCMETGQPLINTVYGEGAAAIVCHILPKRKASQGGVPSMAKDKRCIVYLDGDVHDKMDADLGTKSEGLYVKSMKIFPLLKQRVAEMWPDIPADERRNVPEYLKPE